MIPVIKISTSVQFFNSVVLPALIGYFSTETLGKYSVRATTWTFGTNKSSASESHRVVYCGTAVARLRDRCLQTRREMRTGISGIEKTLQAQQATVNTQISKAFEDLSNLMTMAKDTVNLSKNLVSRLKNKQGEITEDETIQLKSYLLSLGVDDPVTRDAYGSDNSYYRGLAVEVSSVMAKPLKVERIWSFSVIQSSTIHLSLCFISVGERWTNDLN